MLFGLILQLTRDKARLEPTGVLLFEEHRDKRPTPSLEERDYSSYIRLLPRLTDASRSKIPLSAVERLRREETFPLGTVTLIHVPRHPSVQLPVTNFAFKIVRQETLTVVIVCTTSCNGLAHAVVEM